MDLDQIRGRGQHLGQVKRDVDPQILADTGVDLEGVPGPRGGLVDLQHGPAQPLFLEDKTQIDQAGQVVGIDVWPKGIALEDIGTEDLVRDRAQVCPVPIVGHHLAKIKAGRLGHPTGYRRIGFQRFLGRLHQ